MIAWFRKKQRLQSPSEWSGIKLMKSPNPYMGIKNILIVYKGSFLMIFDSVELFYKKYVHLCNWV